MQTIMDATVQVLVQVSEDPAVAKRYTDFQRFGAAGPDGEAGNADDLTNPVTEYLQ